MDIQQIDPNIYVATAYPGINVGLVLTEEGPISIDAPLLPEDIGTWQKAIQDLTGKPLRYTILTDHRPERRSIPTPRVGSRNARFPSRNSTSPVGSRSMGPRKSSWRAFTAQDRAASGSG